MTKTAAYNANEVAAVYMSLNRDDLLSTDEGGSRLSSDTTLRNGFYGLSDPFNLRGMLESFEADFSQGSGQHSYRIRILNPTSELEVLLLGFYDEVFPSTTSTFKQFKTAAEKEARMLDVEGATGDQDEGLLANDSPPQLPSVYLRFGYGTDADAGLSRIHKAKIFDIKYYVSDKEDRVIELHAVDLFSYSKQNPDFNRRPYLARVQVSDETDGQLSLRKPSEILTDIFALYTSTYPECVPLVDLGSYTDSIDGLVYSVAKALGESDAIADLNASIKEEGLEGTTSESVTAEGLTEEEVKAFEDLLDRPLITAKNIDRGVDGTVTPQILYQAFKMVFESIGLKWEMNPVGTPEPVTGVLSPNQTTGSNVDPEKGLEDETNLASNINNLEVNIQTEWLQSKFEPSYTQVSGVSREKVYRLSFWPMGYYYTFSGDGSSENPYTYHDKKIRPLTTQEKHENPKWRVWLNAGMVNDKNYKTMSPINDDKSFKFSFPFEKLETLFTTEDAIRARDAVSTGQGDSYLHPIPVSHPVTRLGYNRNDTLVLWGEQDKPLGTFDTFSAPLVNLERGSIAELSKVAPGKPRELPDSSSAKPFKEWINYAVNFSSMVDPYQASSSPEEEELQFNPPLVNLEPTAETALWILKNTQNYDENKQKQLEDQRKAVEELGKFADQTFSGLTKFIPERPKPSEAERFRRFIDRFSNAYVSMGDDGENPHVSAFLQSILNNLNRLLIGKSDKMRIVQVQVNALTPADKKNLKENSAIFKDVDWEEVWAEKNNCLLLVMPEDSIISQYSDSVIRPILSFPQTNRGTGPNYCWLDYGTPDSIVAKVEFTGDTRVLVNLAQSNYTVRQWNDVKQLFDGGETLSNELISNTISNILADKIANIDGSQSVEAQQQQRGELQRLQKIANDQSNMEINVELLELLPELLSAYQVDPKTGEDELTEIELVSPNTALELRKLASIVSNPKMLHMLYPDVYGENGQNNETTVPSIKVTANGIVREDKPVRILRRRIDLDSIRSRISKVEQSRKMTDVAYNYSVAMQEEVFDVKLTTLGIPEIDDPASEFLSRRICFKYYDPRLANGSLHWLSGVYQLTGFKHRLNPSQGFLTELEMVRLPNESLTNLKEIT